ncbi:MAG: type II secretion system F family protein [Chthoniobacteraceae bacterium]
MPQYVFEALAPDGSPIAGALDAATRGEAFRQIEARHLAPIEVTEKKGMRKSSPKNGAANGVDLRARDDSAEMPRLNRSRLIFFTSELADLLDAGLPVQQALNVMAERQQDPLIRRIATQVRHHLREGQTLAAAFRLSSRSFDDLYTSLIAAGEASGTLPGVLHRMGQSMQQIYELQRRFLQALIYPALMIGACALLMGVFVLVLVPQLTSLLSKTGQQLPAITLLLLDFSAFCTAHWWHGLLIAAVVFITFRLFIGTGPGRLWWDRAKMKIPLIGVVIETRFYAGFTQALGNLLTNGVPLLSSLKLLVRGTSNRFFRQRLQNVIESVAAGLPLANALRRAGRFQPLLTDIVTIGEQTGNLSRSLQKAAARYDKELDARIKRLTALISPLIIIILACVVTVIAYCIVTSIFSAVSGIRARA